MRRPHRRVVLAAALAGLSLVASASAEGPPVPDYFWAYGRVLVGGANVTPAAQPLIALVNGKACGESQTQVVPADPGNPPADVGKTAYTVNILADGDGPSHRPGCGRSGDIVSFYLPLSRRMAEQHPAFQPGPARVDLSLGPPMPNRLAAPLVSNDGTP